MNSFITKDSDTEKLEDSQLEKETKSEEADGKSKVEKSALKEKDESDSKQ